MPKVFRWPATLVNRHPSSDVFCLTCLGQIRVYVHAHVVIVESLPVLARYVTVGRAGQVLGLLWMNIARMKARDEGVHVRYCRATIPSACGRRSFFHGFRPAGRIQLKMAERDGCCVLQPCIAGHSNKNRSVQA